LAQYFPEFDRYFSRSETESLAIVRWCLAPWVISGLEYDRFVRLVTAGKRGVGRQHRLGAIWQKASVSIGCDVGEAMKFEAKLMVESLSQIREVLGDTEAKIKQICLQFPEYPYLLTIPGFGPGVSSMVLGAIGDPFRFKTAKQVLKTAGLDLSADRSGNRVDTAVPVISKNGKAGLRYALYQGAMVASTKNRDFMIWFTNKLRGRDREKGIKTKMRVKLSAKLLVIAWTLMKRREPFNPDYLNIE